MSTAVSTYAFINAKLRARISKLLGEEFFRTLARSRTLVEAVGHLAQTEYAPAADIYSQTGDVKLVELEVVRVERRALSGLRRYIPDGITPFADAVLDQYQVASLKQALRLWFERSIRGRPVEAKVAYLLRGEDAEPVPVDAIVNARDKDDLLSLVAPLPYGGELTQPLSRLADEQSLFWAEVRLDRWYAEHLVAAAKRLSRRDADAALRLLGIQIDVQNVNWLVRMKHYHRFNEAQLSAALVAGGTIFGTEELVKAYRSERPIDAVIAGLGSRYSSVVPSSAPHEESNPVRRLGLVEELLRSILFHDIHATLGGYPFTIGTMVAYFLLKQNEARTLRTVLDGKHYQLSQERIEELL